MELCKQIEELARIEFESDFIALTDGVVYHYDGYAESATKRDYDDLNVLHRIVCGMSRQILRRFHHAIITMYHNGGAGDSWSFVYLLEAPQIREAILRAYGKWEAVDV